MRPAGRPVGRIDAVFTRSRQRRSAAFVAFLMAGDPDLETSERLIEAVVSGGADILELGVPFSDPIADGPTNQAAAARALASGTTLAGVLDLSERTRRRFPDTPIVLFSYFNPILAFGISRFARAAARAGVDGVLCVDLPPEEGGELRTALAQRGIDSIYLLAPTSPRARIALTARASSGFVYYVSRAGVTGEQSRLSPGLAKEVRAVRAQLRRLGLPLAVGFGISTPEQVAAVGQMADAVVVGSALVHCIEEGGDAMALAARMHRRVRELSSALGMESAREGAR